MPAEVKRREKTFMKEELSTLADEIRKCGEALQRIADLLKNDVPSEKLPTLEEVRAVLAKKAREGFTGEVKELLKKHGAERLSDVKAERYKDLLKDAEVMGDA